LAAEQFRILEVDGTNAHHAEAIFRSIYGEDFPVKYVYDPKALCSEIEAKRLFAILATDSEGRPAGYLSMFRAALNPHLWEAGNMLVHPAYARTDVASRLAHHYFQAIPARAVDADGIFGEAVCCHYYTQVMMVKAGMIDCAVELDQLEGDSFKDGKSNKAGSDRISCVLLFLELTDPMEPEYLPARYASILRSIAGTLRPRRFLESMAPLPDSGDSSTGEEYFASSRTWKIIVRNVGSNFAALIRDILEEAQRRGAISLQITLNMACPCIGAAAEHLREQGFFFGGLAPRWFGTDGLLMQKVFGSKTDWENTKVYTPAAKEILAFLRSDREAQSSVGWDAHGHLGINEEEDDDH
jgi:hypothetical protein